MYEEPDVLHFCVKTEHFNIVHLDSVLAYTKQKQRDLIVGTEQLMKVFDETDPTKTTIILTHYSYDFLNKSEQKLVLKLMEKYNVQLWLAGHEHDRLLRKQMDYFYEFQCGNLIHENGETRSCVAVGVFDTEKHNGSIQAWYWDSPNGWTVDAYISREKDRSKYNFALQNSAAATDQMNKEKLKRRLAEQRKKRQESEAYSMLCIRYMQCLTSREFTDGAIYYWIWMDEKHIGGQTLWTGWQDEACTKEIRRLRPVAPDKVMEIGEKTKKRIMVVNSKSDAEIFQICGGEAVVRKDICEQYLPMFCREYIAG